MRKEELRTYIENHESEMIEDLKSLIRIPSEKQAAEPGKPFGAPAAEALAQGIEILEKYGFAVTNYDNYAIAADFNQEEKGLDILARCQRTRLPSKEKRPSCPRFRRGVRKL